eukprot:1778791-Rhodomonas_salina.1
MTASTRYPSARRTHEDIWCYAVCGNELGCGGRRASIKCSGTDGGSAHRFKCSHGKTVFDVHQLCSTAVITLAAHRSETRPAGAAGAAPARPGGHCYHDYHHHHHGDRAQPPAAGAGPILKPVNVYRSTSTCRGSLFESISGNRSSSRLGNGNDL